MSAPRRKARHASDINVTPFVDVMLVLLVIFMVTAPMMTEGLEVALPHTDAVESLPVDSDHTVVGVASSGAVFVDEQGVELADLTDRLRAGSAAGKKDVFLRADRTVPYGTVVDVMGRIREAGIERFGVVAERPEEAGR